MTNGEKKNFFKKFCIIPNGEKKNIKVMNNRFNGCEKYSYKYMLMDDASNKISKNINFPNLLICFFLTFLCRVCANIVQIY